MKENILPNSKEAEQAVLGSMFLSKYALQKCIELLNADHFFFDAHKQLYLTLSDLAEADKTLDITIVTAELEKRKILKNIGGVEYLVELTEKVPSAVNVDSYINIVLEKATLRKLISEASEIVDLAYSKDESLNEVLDSAERKIFSVAKTRKGTEFKTIQEVLFKTQSDIEKLAQTKGEITGLATGFYDLDKITSGLHPNELTIIASRPGMGKTAFVLNVACNIAMNSEKPVVVFNMEMSAEQLAMRMLSSIGQIEGYKLRSGKLEHHDWKKINEAISRLSDTHLFIDDTPGMTIGDIRAKCRRLASSHEGLEAIFIDYLQLISGSAKHAGNRQQEVAEISRSLKTLAMELNVPIIALAQLSRLVEGREDKRPLLSDLRESGTIEQDADVVAFLYRDDYYDKNKTPENHPSESEYIIRKHRNGPVGMVKFIFKRDTSTFRNFANVAEE